MANLQIRSQRTEGGFEIVVAGFSVNLSLDRRVARTERSKADARIEFEQEMNNSFVKIPPSSRVEVVSNSRCALEGREF